MSADYWALLTKVFYSQSVIIANITPVPLPPLNGTCRKDAASGINYP
jgi:hypothetical protein